MDTILGHATRSVKLLNEWLAENGCPEYAELYQSAGERYGVRWDIAIFQSTHETAYWTFRGDVPESHNNFSGIGATGGGNPGEKFNTPKAGILAQIQHLAEYAGVDVPEAETVAERTRYVDDWIRGTAKYWKDLTGRWATDMQYWQKIQGHMRKFDKWAAERLADEAGYWVDIFKSGNAFLMKGSLAVDMVATGLLVDKISVIKDYFGTRAATFTVAPHDKPEPTIIAPEPEPITDSLLVDPEATFHAKDVWIDWAEDFPRMYTKYKYPKGYTEGAIVHHTAGGDIVGSLQYLSRVGFPCLGNSRQGVVYQPFPLSEGGPHCGSWHHRRMVGIESAGWGKLVKIGNKFYAWPKKDGRYLYEVPEHRVRHIPKQDGNRQPGYYEMFTDVQEKSLLKVILWCKVNAPDIFSIDNVLGHDEVTPANKNDPGGSLSMNMADFRALVEQEYQKLKAAQ